MDRPTNSELLQRFQGNRTVECVIHDQAYFFLAGLGPMAPTGLLESIRVGERGAELVPHFVHGAAQQGETLPVSVALGRCE